MRILSLFTALILSFPNVATSQQASHPTAQAPQRDPQALAILYKMLSVSGWSATNIPADAVASGIVTRYHGDPQDAVRVTLKFKGHSKARIEVADAASPTTTIINGDQAAVSKSTGTRVIPAHSALSKTVNGQEASRLEFDYIPASDVLYSRVLRRAGHVTLWISTASFLPIQVQYPRISNDNPTAVFLAIRAYSEYRTISGIAIPFHQDEYLGNQLNHSLQLSTVNFNTGLPDADFAIAVTAQ